MMRKEVTNMVTSVRSLTTLAIIGTYCLIMLGLTMMACAKMVTVEVFLAMFASFNGIVGSIITFYYVSKKRPEENGNGENKSAVLRAPEDSGRPQ